VGAGVGVGDGAGLTGGGVCVAPFFCAGVGAGRAGRFCAGVGDAIKSMAQRARLELRSFFIVVLCEFANCCYIIITKRAAVARAEIFLRRFSIEMPMSSKAFNTAHAEDAQRKIDDDG
jgi:hypothetical protein